MILSVISYKFPNTVPHAAPSPNFSSEPGDTKSCDRTESGGRNREAALDRTHAKGGKLQMPTCSVPRLWDRWKGAPIPCPRSWELQKHTFLERFLSGDLTQLPILSRGSPSQDPWVHEGGSWGLRDLSPGHRQPQPPSARAGLPPGRI